MRPSLAGVAACILLLGIAACGTGGGNPPGQPRVQASSRPSATPTLKASPSPSPTSTQTPSGPPTPAFNNWTTYGFDNNHDGFNPNTSQITPASLASLHLAWAVSAPAIRTQTQPILATAVGSHAGILIVGGAQGVIYAYDALTGAAIWSRSFGSATMKCQGEPPNLLGIAGSAVYDPTTQNIYVTDNQNTTANGPTQLVISQVNVLSGALGPSVNIAPSPLPGELNFSHTSLTLSNGVLYAGTGTTCDISSWRGRVVAVNEASMTLASTFFTVWNQSQAPSPPAAPFAGGGVWGWGGVSIDPAGNVWAATGNLDTQTGTSGVQPPFEQDALEYDAFGEHVLQLTPNLSTVLQSNYPGFVFDPPLSIDLDISGTPILGQPIGCDEALGVQGKSGYLYLYDTTAIGSGPIARYKFTTSSYNDPNLGNPAFSPLTGLYYAVESSQVTGGVIGAPGMIAIKPCDSTASIVWSTEFGDNSMLSGTPWTMPTVTAGGVVIVGAPCKLDGEGGCTGTGPYGGAFWAVDASTGEVLYKGRPIITTPAAVHMGVVVDGDWVYAFDMSGDLYGLTIDPNYPTIPNPSLRERQLESGVR